MAEENKLIETPSKEEDPNSLIVENNNSSLQDKLSVSSLEETHNIQDEIIKSKNDLDMSIEDIHSYTRKYMSVKKGKKIEENWTPKR